MSWHLPAQPLRRRVLIPFAMLTLATVQVATLVSPHLGVTPDFPVKAALAFAGAATIAAGHIADTHPFARLGAANIVTAVRLLLTSLAAGLIGEPPSPSVAAFAAALALVVTSMDGVDGWLARRFGTASVFGARFDMETDALLILVLALLAWLHGKAGAWIVLAGAMRYLFVAASYGWPWMDAPLPPSTRRKAVCVLQIVGLGVVVSPLVSPPASVAAAAVTLVALTWSFGIDVLWLRRHSA